MNGGQSQTDRVLLAIIAEHEPTYKLNDFIREGMADAKRWAELNAEWEA